MSTIRCIQLVVLVVLGVLYVSGSGCEKSASSGLQLCSSRCLAFLEPTSMFCLFVIEASGTAPGATLALFFCLVAAVWLLSMQSYSTTFTLAPNQPCCLCCHGQLSCPLRSCFSCCWHLHSSMMLKASNLVAFVLSQFATASY